MNFLYENFLYYLILCLIPVLFYILRKPDVPVILIPTIQFIKKAGSKRKKIFNIRQFIMLLLRIFSIVFFVLAISSPVFRSMFFHGNSMVYIVVDNSLSVNSKFENVEEYKKYINQFIDNMNIKNTVFVFRNSIDYSFSLNRDLSRIEFVECYFSLKEAVEYLYTRYENAENIIVVSDMQQSIFSGLNQNILDRINFVKIKSQNRSNIFIKKIEYNRSSFINNIEKIIVEIEHSGEKNIATGKISLFKENTLTDYKLITVENNKNVVVEFETDRLSTGFNNFRIEIEGDDFIQDNIHYCAIYARDKINILYTGSTVNSYLRRALFFNETISPFYLSQINRASVESADFIIVDDISDIENEIDKLKKAIETEKTILIFLNEDRKKFNNYLFDNGISPVKLVDNAGGIRKVENHDILEKFNFYLNNLLDGYKFDEVTHYFDDKIPALINKKTQSYDIYFYNMLFNENTTDFILSPYFVYYWYDFLISKTSNNNHIIFADNYAFIPGFNNRKEKILPGYYYFENKMLVSNIPLSESYAYFREFDNEISTYELEKTDSSVNLSRISAVSVLILLLLLFWFEDKWLYKNNEVKL
ncbi:MAG: BatA domain-containing protein [Candidatus Muiribacteriota bacterium]